MKKLFALSYLFVVLSLSLLFACQDTPWESASKQNIEVEPPVDAQAGETLYNQICALCHGPGAPPEADLIAVTKRMDYADFDDVLNEGVGEMPAFSSIKEPERRNLWEFLKTHDGE